MQEVHERVFVTNEESCQSGSAEFAVIHACKTPCHQLAVGYKGSLPNTHPNYLVLEREYDLYLNIIDPPVPLFKPGLFSSFMKFANKHWTEQRTIIIHCNQGQSRAPSLALLFLAKCLCVINNDSYHTARVEFEAIYPIYRPGNGIETYFEKNWGKLGGAF